MTTKLELEKQLLRVKKENLSLNKLLNDRNIELSNLNKKLAKTNDQLSETTGQNNRNSSDLYNLRREYKELENINLLKIQLEAVNKKLRERIEILESDNDNLKERYSSYINGIQSAIEGIVATNYPLISDPFDECFNAHPHKDNVGFFALRHIYSICDPYINNPMETPILPPLFPYSNKSNKD